MNLVLLSIIDLLLYYICLYSIGFKILEGKPKRILSYVSLILFILICIIEIIYSNKFFIIFHSFIQMLEVLLIKLSFRKIRLLSIASAYILLFLINTIIVACIISIISIESKYEWIIELSINILSTITCLFICYSSFNRKIKQVIYWTSKSIKRLFLLLLFIGSILVVFILNESFYKSIENWSYVTKVILIIFVVLLSIAAPVLIIYSMTNNHFKNLNANYEKQINVQAEHYILLSQSNYDLRRFRHDYNNICIGLSKLISEDNRDAALDLLSSNSLNLNNTAIKFDTGNGIVDALLTDKQNHAKKINTKIDFEGTVTSNKIEPTDLCVIFGNTIDNALEACEKIKSSENKSIQINCQCSGGFMFLNITNPVYHEVPINKNFISTTKEDKHSHGFGLFSVNKVIKKYNGKLNMVCINKEFTISIDLCLL